MMTSRHPNLTLAACLGMALTLASSATAAYIGPGAGLTAIGSVIALLGAVVFATLGFVWYPIKRLRAGARNKRSPPADAKSSSSKSAQSPAPPEQPSQQVRAEDDGAQNATDQ